MSKSFRLKGHGGFIMREGWYSKALVAIRDNPEIFSRENFFGADDLGVGSAMAKAIKYWMNAAGLAETIQKKGVCLTRLGQLVCRYDTYLDDIFTLWLIHLQLIKNKEKVTMWNLFFGTMPAGEFTREEMERRMMSEFLAETKVEKRDVSERSFTDDITTLLKMYLRPEEKTKDPEEKTKSDFAKLHLLDRTFQGFERLAVRENQIPLEIVEIALSFVLSAEGSSISELLTGSDSPGRLFCMDRLVLNDYLEQLEGSKAIRVDRTAGLDVVYFEKKGTVWEIVEQYYKGQRGK